MRDTPEDMAKLGWDDLPDTLRIAMLRRAKTDQFWRDVAQKLGALKTVATVILTLIALWSVLGELLGEFLQRLIENNQGGKP